MKSSLAGNGSAKREVGYDVMTTNSFVFTISDYISDFHPSSTVYSSVWFRESDFRYVSVQHYTCSAVDETREYHLIVY